MLGRRVHITQTGGDAKTLQRCSLHITAGCTAAGTGPADTWERPSSTQFLSLSNCRFYLKLLTDRQTNGQTDIQTDKRHAKYNLIGENTY